MKAYHYILIGAGAVVLLSLTFLLGRVTAHPEPLEPISRDTVVVYHTDTIVHEKPVYYAKTVIDTVMVPVTDTLRLRDTLYIGLPREQRAYRDTSYQAWVSGVRPQLDSIRIFAPVRTVTVTERVPVEVPCRWGIGVSAGYGLSVGADRTVTLAPFLGIGITYNLLSW